MRITLSVKEASELIGVSSDLIYQMVREQQIPHLRVRRRILFHKETLEEWIKAGGSFD